MPERFCIIRERVIDILRNYIMGWEGQDLLVYHDYALKDWEGGTLPPLRMQTEYELYDYICEINKFKLIGGTRALHAVNNIRKNPDLM